MSVVYKSVGTTTTATSGTTVGVAMPALAVGDFVAVIVWYFATGTVTAPSGKGWAEVGTQAVDGSIWFRVFWKYAATSSSAGTDTFTVPSGGGLTKPMVFTGADNSAPTRTDVKNTTPAAYWQSPSISGAGFRAAWAMLYSARASSGAFTTSGTISSTNTSRAHETVLSTLRHAVATYDVASATAGFVRATVTGGTTTSTVVMLTIPVFVAPTASVFYGDTPIGRMFYGDTEIGAAQFGDTPVF